MSDLSWLTHGESRPPRIAFIGDSFVGGSAAEPAEQTIDRVAARILERWGAAPIAGAIARTKAIATAVRR